MRLSKQVWENKERGKALLQVATVKLKIIITKQVQRLDARLDADYELLLSVKIESQIRWFLHKFQKKIGKLKNARATNIMT